MRPAQPDQLEAGVHQNHVIWRHPANSATPSEQHAQSPPMRSRAVGPRLLDEVYAPSTLRIFLREFIFGALMLVVLTTTARAAPLHGGQPYSPDGSAAGTRQKFGISPGPPNE